MNNVDLLEWRTPTSTNQSTHAVALSLPQTPQSNLSLSFLFAWALPHISQDSWLLWAIQSQAARGLPPPRLVCRSVPDGADGAGQPTEVVVSLADMEETGTSRTLRVVRREEVPDCGWLRGQICIIPQVSSLENCENQQMEGQWVTSCSKNGPQPSE